MSQQCCLSFLHKSEVFCITKGTKKKDLKMPCIPCLFFLKQQMKDIMHCCVCMQCMTFFTMQ